MHAQSLSCLRLFGYPMDCRPQAFLLQQVSSVVVACRVWNAGSTVVVHGLSCSVASAIFPDQGLNPCPLNWQARVLFTVPPEKSLKIMF